MESTTSDSKEIDRSANIKGFMLKKDYKLEFDGLHSFTVKILQVIEK